MLKTNIYNLYLCKYFLSDGTRSMLGLCLSLQDHLTPWPLKIDYILLKIFNELYFFNIILFYFSTWFYCKTVVFPEVCNCHFYFIHKTKVLIRFSSRPALYIVSSKAQSSHFFPKELPPTEPLPPLKLPSFSTAADNGHPRTFLYYSVAWVLWEILSIIFIISLWKRTPSFNWAYCHLI